MFERFKRVKATWKEKTEDGEEEVPNVVSHQNSFFAAYLELHKKKEPVGEVFEKTFLIEASNAASALKKAHIIMSAESSGKFPVSDETDQLYMWKAIGITKFAYVEDKLVSGCEIDVSFLRIDTLQQATETVLSEQKLNELKFLEPDFDPPLEVYFGEDFDKA